MMDILMSETFWAHKKWNKITSDFKLVFYSSTITMMHGPINIDSYEVFRFLTYCSNVVVNISVLFSLSPYGTDATANWWRTNTETVVWSVWSRRTAVRLRFRKQQLYCTCCKQTWIDANLTPCQGFELLEGRWHVNGLLATGRLKSV